ncbi:MAG: TylF/MycF/NovP-related O-methyltransferase [Dehalococcoidia bacterium]
MVQGQPGGRGGATLNSNLPTETGAARHHDPLHVRILDNYPGIRAFIASAHTVLPLPLSRWAYRLGRALVFRDPRREGFEQAMFQVVMAGGEGDYLEFGVHRGVSVVLAHDLAQHLGLRRMRFFAFDSFEGLPEGEGTKFFAGRFRFPVDRFLRYIARAGVDLARVFPVQGWFSDTLTPRFVQEYRLERIAIAHVDCDLYASTRDVLAFLETRLSPGSVVIFDDWYAYDDEADPSQFGEQRALAESSLRDRLELLYDLPGVHRIFVVRG